MQRTLTLTLGLAVGLFGLQSAVVHAAPKEAKASTAKFDPAKSQIKWVGKKVTGQHDGTVKLKSGQVQFKGDEVTGGEFVVDLTSLAVLDLKESEGRDKLEGHLKSDDFFGVDKFPTATLVVKSVKALAAEAGKPTHEVSGDLTIKGKTSPVTFPATVKLAGASVTADATVTVDRTLYDIRYGSGKFFENLGNKMIDDTFTLQIHLEGQR